MSQPSEPRPPVSVARILAVVLPAAIVGIAAYVWSSQLETTIREESAPNMIARMFTAETVPPVDDMQYPDKDGDLVADAPDDPADCIDPQVLVFSFVAGDVESVEEPKWKELLSALGEKTGRAVKYTHYGRVDDQLGALQKGESHIAGLNTGIVPTAVQRHGFVPLCTFGREDGSYGYTMQFLVPAGSAIKKLDDVRGHKVTFTRLDSNSGFKAPLVTLMDHKMLPDRDYQWGFSQGHEESIRRVAAKEFEVAPVASDILTRMVEQGDVAGDAYVSIYESERFPPATIGIAYNLTPQLRTAILEALLGFHLTGTGIEGEFGADVTRFVPVKYKDDWANTRRIDQVVADARNKN